MWYIRKFRCTSFVKVVDVTRLHPLVGDVLSSRIFVLSICNSSFLFLQSCIIPQMAYLLNRFGGPVVLSV